jgi:HSP20 family protein
VKKDKKQTEKEDKNFNFDLGQLGLGNLFAGIENLVNLAQKLKEAGGEIKKEGEIDLSHIKEGMSGIFGVSIRTVTGGKPVVEQFGNIKKTPKGPVVEEEREPITDVFNEKTEIRIYAEMPGVNEEDIKIELKGDVLNIYAQNKNRNYRKEILLPEKVKTETFTSNYKNGVLSINIKK